jgi:hypothetical protein
MDKSEEIPPQELHLYVAQLRDAVESVCRSRAFRTSPKSCEFLRHVVHHALLGDFDQLKERLIGMTLLGRDASYDTGSDAGVRVRANEVRKRLIACRETQPADAVFSFELPPGSYIPHFLRRADSSSPSVCHADHAIELDDRPPRPLSHQQLALPTLVALFLCTMCLRWQVAQEHPFMAFWETVFHDRHATLYIQPVYFDKGQELIAAQQFTTVGPLLNLAGQFHSRFNLASAAVPPTAAGDILISIGEVADNTGAPASAPADTNRITFMTTSHGREIFDHGSSDPHRLAGRAALLTIANGDLRSIRIDGTDNAAIRSLIDILCARDSFPEMLSDTFQRGTTTQAVFLFTQHPDIVVFHEPLSSAQAGATQTQ